MTPEGVVHERLSLASRLQLLRRQWAIACRLTWFEVKARYFGRVLGLLWLWLDPLLFAALYLFLVTAISIGTVETDLYLGILVSVVVWRWFSRTLDNAPVLITSYGGILKQTNFSLGTLITSFIGVELFGFLVSLLLMFLVLGFWPGYGFHLTWIWVPLLMLVQGSLMVALSLFAATVGAFVKDLAGFLYVFTSIWWYLSPGIYDPDLIEPKLAGSIWLDLFRLNPFYPLFLSWKAVMVEGRSPESQWILGLFAVLGVSLVLLWAGLVVLRRSKHLFFRVI